MVLSRSLLGELALEAGFDLVAFGPADPGADAARFAEWIAAGRHGDMSYLARNAERIQDPSRLVEGAKSTLALGFDYGSNAAAIQGGARIARYASGRDYHRALGKRLRTIEAGLEKLGLTRSEFRSGVDAVPVLERALAARAGLGFLAKSGGIIHAKRGPWLLLAEIVTSRELPEAEVAAGSCGSCTACLDACPTDALVAPFQVDARRCLSYTTIEKRGPIPPELREPQGDWLFGCDICIEVCPFTSRSAKRRRDPDLAPHRVVETWDLVGVLELDPQSFDEQWTGTALRRATRNGLRRNAAIVLGNRGDRSAAPQLCAVLRDQDAGVRTSAAWALSRLGAEREAVAHAVDAELDPSVKADLAASLARF